MISDFYYIIQDLEMHLDSNRFAHTMGVSYTAACLAMRYGYDMNRAYLAGLLHDCAKYMTHSQRLDYCKEYNIPVSKIELSNSALLHAKVGADMCNRKYFVNDKEIYDAVLYHTTGHPQMSLLDKIIYIADYIEPNRKPLPNMEHVRSLAFTDIDSALCCILSSTIKHLETSNKEVDPMTEKTYHYYIKEE